MIAAWIALGALVLLVAALLAVHSLPAALAALTAVLVAGLWAYALWLARRANARRYHRHGRDGVRHHIRPTRRRRVHLFLRHLLSVRLRATDGPETAQEPNRAPTPGKELREIQQVFGTAARIVPAPDARSFNPRTAA